MTTPRLLATGVVAALGLALLGAALDEPEAAAEAVVEAPAPPPPPAKLQGGAVAHTIANGEVLGRILPRYGLTRVGAVVDAAKEHQDLTRIRAGKQLRFHYARGAETPVALSYQVDEDTTLVVHTAEQPYTAELQEVVYEPRMEQLVLTVKTSLWDAALAAGLRPADIVTLAGIFEYEVDFNSELQPGAQFTRVPDQLYAEGDKVKAGDVHAVRLENGDDTYTSIRYVSKNDETGWYAPDGTARKRPFLRSPLAFDARITSRFNLKRFHPIARKRRPHYGTDFGAPTGTPVRATGDGVVQVSGRNGGHGLYVKLDHAGPYTSSYSHLSKLKVKKGQRVKQGDVIGLVGSTGYSTGPHLHYEFRVDGQPVDAMKVKLPQAIELPRAEKGAFQVVAQRMVPLLDGVPLPGEVHDTGAVAVAEAE